jgi:inorganic pyrophosphatase
MDQAERGDGDPLDICVLSERPIARSEVILNTRVVGGLPMLDNEEADDKIIAVLENDYVWGNVQDISELPQVLVERLHHYFSTYKLVHGEVVKVTVNKAYDRRRAEQVIRAAIADYEEKYGD